jgi:hypothetical protein
MNILTFIRQGSKEGAVSPALNTQFPVGLVPRLFLWLFRLSGHSGALSFRTNVLIVRQLYNDSRNKSTRVGCQNDEDMEQPPMNFE